jgi:hypothetical protein
MNGVTAALDRNGSGAAWKVSAPGGCQISRLTRGMTAFRSRKTAGKPETEKSERRGKPSGRENHTSTVFLLKFKRYFPQSHHAPRRVYSRFLIDEVSCSSKMIISP